MCKCYICNVEMDGSEIKFNEQIRPLVTEPCGTCMAVIIETANGKGFKQDDDDFEQVDEDFDVIPFDEYEYNEMINPIFERGYD